MADNTPILDASDLVEDIATDELITLNGADVSGASPRIKAQRNKIVFGSPTTATDVDATHPLPVVVESAIPAGSNNIGDVDVASLPTLPAGTNVIGHVVVDSAPNPALPAGTNNIGDVDVLTLPSIPAGSNAIGSVDTELTTTDVDTGAGTDTRAVVALVSAENGGGVVVGSGAPLPTNVIGSIPAGSNNIGDVGVASLPSIPTGTNTIGTVNVGTMPAASVSTDAVGAAPLAETSLAGATPYKLISAASTNATSVKGSVGKVFYIAAFNLNASPRYLKLYDKASAPTVGTDTPKHVFLIPGGSAGAGLTIALPIPAKFASGIAIAITTGIADSDTGAVAASEIVVNLGYV